MISRIVTNVAITIARAAPSGYCAWRVKLTIRLAISAPDATADQGRRQELAQDRDEHEDAGGDDARPDLRQQDVAERLIRSRAEVLGGVELREVELLERRVEREDREREIDVRDHHEHAQVVVDEQGGGLLDEPGCHQELVERTRLAQDRLPGVDP